MDRKLQQLENCKQLQNLYDCKKYKITHESIFKLPTYAIKNMIDNKVSIYYYDK